MNPKKAKDFIKPTSEKLNLDPELVTQVTDFFWVNVKKSLSEMKGISIKVPELGDFKVRRKNIDFLKKKYNNYINSDKNNIYTESSLDKLQKLQKLEELLKEEDKRQLEFKEKKQKYVSDKNMERKE